MLSDLTLPELREYRPEVAEPADFDEFWASELAAARAAARRAVIRRRPTPGSGTPRCST